MNIRRSAMLVVALLAFMLCGKAITTATQQVTSGNAVTITSGTVTANAGTGTFNVGDGSGPLTVDGTVTATGPLTDTQLRATPVPVSGTVTTSPSALVTGTANVGIIRAVPSSCTQATPFASTTVGIATGAGTSVTSTTTCMTLAYANNITNSPVTFRLQDKTGTPIIWFGGNADFLIPANSAVRIPVEGVSFVGGITAIAGTASAINLHVTGLQ